MFIPEDPKTKPKCGVCGSTSYETVISGHGGNAARFKRCCACGHQSAREYLHPGSSLSEMSPFGRAYSAIRAASRKF